MIKPTPLRIGIAILLGSATVLLALDTYDILQTTPDKHIEVAVKVLLAFFAGIGAIYMLAEKQLHEIELKKLEARMAFLNDSLRQYQDLQGGIILEKAKAVIAEHLEPRIKAIEVAAASATKLAELEHEDDFRRRQRRDSALVELSRTLSKTTKAFRTLAKFRLTEGVPSESLVGTLSQALAIRESFLSAREELTILRAIDRSHEDMLRSYSKTLVDIIIDVRRNSSTDLGKYDAMMTRYEGELDRFDRDIERFLSVFLAPRDKAAEDQKNSSPASNRIDIARQASTVAN